MGIIVLTLSNKSKIIMADNCNPVFNLATLEVTMVMSARFMKILKSVTDKSLNKINPTKT